MEIDQLACWLPGLAMQSLKQVCRAVTDPCDLPSSLLIHCLWATGPRRPALTRQVGDLQHWSVEKASSPWERQHRCYPDPALVALLPVHITQSLCLGPSAELECEQLFMGAAAGLSRKCSLVGQAVAAHHPSQLWPGHLS